MADQQDNQPFRSAVVDFLNEMGVFKSSAEIAKEEIELLKRMLENRDARLETMTEILAIEESLVTDLQMRLDAEHAAGMETWEQLRLWKDRAESLERELEEKSNG